ncbi:hypothetical protein [Dyadobacter sp. OTU695]|uniref:hypothetical protein n=1 Tax=Dyadobacter sp. OTU695 TaxID=3043860 RepID=UPI00313A8353
MTTNTENKNELGNPTAFGIALGLAISIFFGPAGAVIGFIIGAALGFWFDKKQNHPVKKPSDNANAGAGQHSTIHCNH